MRSSFQILAHGRELDVDGLLRAVGFEFSQVWRRGDPMGSFAYRTGGVAIELGDGYSLPLRDQCRIAQVFVEAHAPMLRTLAGLPGMVTFLLGLQVHQVLSPRTIGFTASAPPALLLACLGVGLRPVFYVTLDRAAEPDV